MIKTKIKEHIYEKVFVNHLTIIFHEANFDKNKKLKKKLRRLNLWMKKPYNNLKIWRLVKNSVIKLALGMKN